MARRKTPAEIERQYARLTMQNYMSNRGNVNRELSRSTRITRAAQNTRAANGYASTEKRTRNLDTIFQRRNGSFFTIQNGREVAYRGKKVNGANGLTNG